MAKHTLRYPPRIRARAIHLARTSGKMHADIARELGISRTTLKRWLDQADRSGYEEHAAKRPHLHVDATYQDIYVEGLTGAQRVAILVDVDPDSKVVTDWFIAEHT